MIMMKSIRKIYIYILDCVMDNLGFFNIVVKSYETMCMRRIAEGRQCELRTHIVS